MGSAQKPKQDKFCFWMRELNNLPGGWTLLFTGSRVDCMSRQFRLSQAQREFVVLPYGIAPDSAAVDQLIPRTLPSSDKTDLTKPKQWCLWHVDGVLVAMTLGENRPRDIDGSEMIEMQLFDQCEAATQEEAACIFAQRHPEKHTPPDEVIPF